MRKQLKDMAVRTSYATKHAPIKIWSESGPEWGGKICAVHRFGRGHCASARIRKENTAWLS